MMGCADLALPLRAARSRAAMVRRAYRAPMGEPHRPEETIVSQDELRRTLMELRRELSEVGEVNPELEIMLSEIRCDIDGVMERANVHPFRERLNDAVERFETTHPRLATAMGAVIGQLANIGV